MLRSRVFKPKEEELVYHYCSPESFFSICKNKTIRLSDIFSMNDFMEMHWGYSIWEEVAGILIPEYGYDFIDKIDKKIHDSGAQALVLAACFSQDGDVLSQWRAYTNDGKGYSIGFKAKDIFKIAVTPLKVLYNKERQFEEVKDVVQKIYESEGKSENKFGLEFNQYCTQLSFDLVSFKNPAFQEEKEIRVVHLLGLKKSNNSLKLDDPGGKYFGDQKIHEIKFRMKESLPVSFIEPDFTNDSQINPIKEIILGPKNDSNPIGISIFLETIGIENVKIKKSEASYR